METNHFEAIVKHHSLCPNDKLYNSNALAGEAGEVANAVKKIQMALLKPEWTQQQEEIRLKTPAYFEGCLSDELSDVLFYLTRLALDNGITLNELMMLQFKKLRCQSDKYKRVFLK